LEAGGDARFGRSGELDRLVVELVHDSILAELSPTAVIKRVRENSLGVQLRA